MEVLLMLIVMLLFYFEVANVLLASVLICLQMLAYTLVHMGVLKVVNPDKGKTLYMAYALALSVISILTGSLAPLLVAITGLVSSWLLEQKFKN